MNANATLSVAGDRRGGHGIDAGIGLWVFMGVVTTLFLLFVTAYVMRMDGADWSAIAMPWQLWLSTALLTAAGVLLQQASLAARGAHWVRVRNRLLAGGACTWAFLAVQLWAWQALYALRVMPAGNPAASFFYLLTALHGLHVAGGLVAWGVTTYGIWHSPDPARTAWRIALCARYWHFLLAVWALLFATLSGLTPDVVRFICGTA
ncbi:bb3-type cytochrome oxidase subunit III [Polaromonas jejuensis]|uniref:Bb3-type cytochrome oxidase subunit III n=1 Tax=Polaromonas jejuensis TaxID=457502 RepID=A0ABW0Q6Z8_9BURK|nr:bb3-type cytochrome oxidase subunit III [Polaromonas jejuensis]